MPSLGLEIRELTHVGREVVADIRSSDYVPRAQPKKRSKIEKVWQIYFFGGVRCGKRGMKEGGEEEMRGCDGKEERKQDWSHLNGLTRSSSPLLPCVPFSHVCRALSVEARYICRVGHTQVAWVHWEPLLGALFFGKLISIFCKI